MLMSSRLKANRKGKKVKNKKVTARLILLSASKY